MSNLAAAVVLTLFLANVFVFCDEDGPEVEIKQGAVKGKYWTTRQGRKFSAFLSIPYAKPPIDDLRFKPPVPAESWDGVLDATKVHNVCPQRNIYTRSDVVEGDEDCLYLNVYTPQLPSFGSDPLPVMLFFHGGGWLCGSGNSMWYGPDMLLDREVVLVVPNFRLGALGFLTTGDEVVPGNNGLKDQNLALKWIRDNIRQFGGDPDSVTLFGESAGGASANLHMVSPVSRGLFHRAISQSGTALTSWAFAPNDQGVVNAKKLAESLNCPTTCTTRMVECLKKIDATTIIAQDKIFMKWDLDPMIPFKPVMEPKLEGAFITEHPIDAIKSGKVAKIPWMVGLNQDEGALRVAALYGNPHLLEELDEHFDKFAPISLLYDETAPNVDYVTKKIRKFYFGDKKIDNSTRFDAVNMYTDGWFFNGIDSAVRLYSKYTKQPVYYYLFGHEGVASFTSVFGDPTQSYGVCHADELQYLFPVGDMLFPDKKADAADKRVSEIMTTLWANFATTGNPTPEINELIPETWKPLASDEMEYYFIGSDNELRMDKELFMERAKFWRNLPVDSKLNEIDGLRDEL